MAKRVKVKKTITGKLQIVYECPSCSTELKSPETDVGNPDVCPTCHTEFVVPGAEQLDSYRKALREEEDEVAAAERSKLEREMRKKLASQQEERERIETEDQKRIAELKQKREATKAEFEAERQRIENMPTKFCPYCFNEVKLQAFRCPHCTEYLTADGKRAFRDSIASGSAAATAYVARKVFGCLMIFCFGGMFVLPLPQLWLGGVLTLALVIATLQFSVSDWKE